MSMVTFLSAGLGWCFPGMCNGDIVLFSSLSFDCRLIFAIKVVGTPVCLAALSVAQVKEMLAVSIYLPYYAASLCWLLLPAYH
jgi:hypothetical protein